MSETLSVAAAFILLAVLRATGLVVSTNISHPFWHVKATLVGNTIVVAITIFLFWLSDRRPVLPAF